MCVYKAEDGVCRKLTDETYASYCVEAPCPDEQPSNADRIRGMTDEELADRNVQLTYTCKLDYDREEEPYENWELVYQTSDGKCFYDEQDAIEHELTWLRLPAGD